MKTMSDLKLSRLKNQGGWFLNSFYSKNKLFIRGALNKIINTLRYRHR